MAAPAALTNVQVQQGNGEVLVSWDYLSTATSGYKVRRSTDQIAWTEVATPVAGVIEYLDDTVTAGTLYYYQVAGVNGDGTGAYSTAQSIVPTHPGQMTLGQLRDLSKQKADRENSDFVTDAEWNTYINQSYFELYDLLVQKFGNDYFVSELELTTDGTASLTLPNGVNHSGARPIYKLLGVDVNVGGSDGWVALRKFEFIRRNQYTYPNLPTNVLGAGGLRYRLVGNTIRFSPTPAAGQTIKLWYVPRMATLLQDNDIADGVSGWTEYIAIDAAIKALNKEESDVQALLLAKQAMIDRIEAAAENRDAGEPEVISRMRGIEYENIRGGWEF